MVLKNTQTNPTVTSTASAAGGWEIKIWTALRDHTVRLEVLIGSQRRLLTRGLVAHSDEIASARRRFQFLTGPSGIEWVKCELRKGTDICWRDPTSDRSQARLSLRNLEVGLQKVREESWKQAKVMRSLVSETYYRRMLLRSRMKSRKIRSMETKRLGRKEEYIMSRSRDCKKHILCKWVRKFRNQIL